MAILHRVIKIPNWCECELEVMGPLKERNRFIKYANRGDEVLDTEMFLPYPRRFKIHDRKKKKLDEERKLMSDEEKETIQITKDSFNGEGYGWCRKNWGTKWGLCHTIKDGEDDQISYSFDCAWSPGTPIVLKMSEFFPKLNFEMKYFECGEGYAGEFRCKAGCVLFNESYDYDGNRGG